MSEAPTGHDADDRSAAARLKADAERQSLREAEAAGPLARLGAYVRLSGPGWLQSAITLGGGSLASSLYLGVLGGFAFLWVQPVAMILGIIMLSAIAYVTTSTQERPFRAINQHVSPVLGWGWLLAALAANMFWCLPQYALANGVMQQNLLPGLLGPRGSLNSLFAGSSPDGWLAANASSLAIVTGILVLSTAITWAYDSGSWGVKLYELLLKLMVGGVVLCFFGVLVAIRNEIDWGAMLAGFLPGLWQFTEPPAAMAAALEGSQNAAWWSQRIVSQQHDVMISAAATAVGINMTFLFPYSMLARGWTREFRGLAVFDLSTGMLIPYVLATSCVVIAAANQFHTQPVPGFLGETDSEGQVIVPPEKARNEYYAALESLYAHREGPARADQLKNAGTLRETLDALPESDRRVAAMLVSRDAFELARSLSRLAGDRVANVVFGLGVLGMALSTITLLMLISGFCICEMFGLPSRGWPHRLGSLAAATGVLGPFIWSKASFYLAVYVSAFGLMLLPIAYCSFLLLMNQRSLLGDDMPRGWRRVWWNGLMLLATTIATAASIYSIYSKLGLPGILAMVAFVVLAVVVQLLRRRGQPDRSAAR